MERKSGSVNSGFVKNMWWTRYRFTLLQDEHQRSETKLTQTTNDLNEASNKTDEINRAIKTLETKNMIDEESKSKIKFILTHEKS